MRALRAWLWVAGALLLTAGAGIGSLAGSWFTRTAESRMFVAQPPGYWRSSLVSSEEVWSELELESGQRDRLQELLSEHYRKVDALRVEQAQLFAGVQESVLAVLTPEQRDRLGEIQQRYAEARTESEVLRELTILRERIGLTADQEPRVYQALFDGSRERRDMFREMFESGDERPDRSAVRERLKEISKRGKDRMERILTPEQFASYTELCDEREQWFRRHRGPPKGGPPKGGEERRDRGPRRPREEKKPPTEDASTCPSPDPSPEAHRRPDPAPTPRRYEAPAPTGSPVVT